MTRCPVRQARAINKALPAPGYTRLKFTEDAVNLIPQKQLCLGLVGQVLQLPEIILKRRQLPVLGQLLIDEGIGGP